MPKSLQEEEAEHSKNCEGDKEFKERKTFDQASGGTHKIEITSYDKG